MERVQQHEARSQRLGVWAGLALLLAASWIGCGSSTETTLVSVSPPDDWVGSLLADRQMKDSQFREDPQTPLLPADVADFKGLDYWPADEKFYMAGSISYYDSPEQFTILTTTGEPRPVEKVGHLSFKIGGSIHALQVYRLLDGQSRPGDSGFFVPFMDLTTGNETYPTGRYVDLVGPIGGPYVLDFNTAYNPSCAYGDPERFACPVTPKENRLELRIEAGERGYKKGVERSWTPPETEAPTTS